MEQIKRPKVTEDAVINDIASSIRELSASVASVSEHYAALLKVNKAVVLYMQNGKEVETLAVDEIESNLKATTIQEK